MEDTMKGITKLKNGKYQAQRRMGGKVVYLGCYVTEEEAAASLEQQPIQLDKLPTRTICIWHDGRNILIDTQIVLSQEHIDYLCDICLKKGYTSFSDLIAILIKQRMIG
jgi:hypothetical protein